MKLKSIIALFVVSTSITFAQTKQVLIENVRILDHKTAALTAPMNVLVSDQKIEKISPSSISVKGKDVTKINGNGKTLMPGLIDVHVHMVFGALTMEQMMSPNATPESLMQNVAVGAHSMLMRGFTSVRDAGGPIFPLKAAIDADKTAGPRI
ncbi:hypothetical protein HMPREF9715_00782 [Myroides odoratimimus CIP 101113]|nr:hypothetical protein HMPREF9715_00782 [Myroides odoratimimus CIP 101113]